MNNEITKSKSAVVNPDTTLSLVQSKLGGQIISGQVQNGQVVLFAKREQFIDLVKILKLDTQLHLDYLVDITAIDYLDKREQRFEVVYHLLSLNNLHRIRIKVALDEQDCSIDTLVHLWPGANFMERECWDMYGITFRGHPDLRRILMYDEFIGHPLRKDYPVQGKQPRVPMRNPEVRNTAVDMQRPALVTINKKKETEQSTARN